MPRFFDTHAHLDDKRLADQLPNVIAAARAAGLIRVMTIATDPVSSRRAVEIAQQFPDFICAAIGFQPNNCTDLTDRDWNEMTALASSPVVRAIGETGLDRYWKDCPFDIQQKWFDRHIEWSCQNGLPLVIHMRECEPDIVDSLIKHKSLWPIRGIMHSFTGSMETAIACLEAGLHISFAGMVTYENADDIRHVSKQIPSDRILIETDSPYLSPEPMRKQRPNQPALVVYTAACIAQARQMSVDDLAEATTRNAEVLLGF